MPATPAPGNVVPLVRRLFSDQITPVLAYRRLVSADARTAPSFLFESVETGGRAGRWSLLGAQPSIEVLATGHDVEIVDRRTGERRRERRDDPLRVPEELGASWRPASPAPPELPRTFTGGWVGYAGYDTVRYLEPGKLPFASAPPDDRRLPDLHFGLYRSIVAIDHVDKLTYAIVNVMLDGAEPAGSALERGRAELDDLVARLQTHSVPLSAGAVAIDLGRRPTPPSASNFDQARFEEAVGRAQRYIAAGDAFQVVLSQRLARTTSADPFDIYRALRVVNPSPYQIYLQAAGSILVASSPEILCRVRDGVVTNRPLAGTRRRGSEPGEDARLERELLADDKERAEHVMLVDLGRNDLGRVSITGSVSIDRCMEVERYSHVMHIASTVTGRLRPELGCWDALRATLPAGTVSGAPKVRAMQIIDEIEPTRRGPYAGGIGCVGLNGDMDIALALRTMVIPAAPPFVDRDPDAPGPHRWTIHLQAGAGIVADSVPSSEHEETLGKAAALGRAIDLAEAAFVRQVREPENIGGSSLYNLP